MENEKPEVLPGQIYVPVCYCTQYDLEVGDVFAIGGQELAIAGFIRDAQMNSMMASSKRFLVNAADLCHSGTAGKRSGHYQTLDSDDECAVRRYDDLCNLLLLHNSLLFVYC